MIYHILLIPMYALCILTWLIVIATLYDITRDWIENRETQN